MVPAHKQRVRASAAKLRTAQAAHVVALAAGAVQTRATAALNIATDALGVTQHHDSLPGTMQTAESVLCPSNIAVVDGLDSCNRTTDLNRQVLEDYTRRLVEADLATDQLTADSVAALRGLPGGSLSFQRVGVNAAAEHVAASVVVFNPSTHARAELVRVEFNQIGEPFKYVVPSVRTNADGGENVAVPAQVEVEDRHTSQLTVSARRLPSLTNVVFFYVTVPPLGTAAFTVEYNRDPAQRRANSTTTVVPEVLVGAAVVAQEGLGWRDDPQCHRATFSREGGLLSGMSIRHDGAGCQSTNASGVAHARVRQTYFQYIDGSGGRWKSNTTPLILRMLSGTGPALAPHPSCRTRAGLSEHRNIGGISMQQPAACSPIFMPVLTHALVMTSSHSKARTAS